MSVDRDTLDDDAQEIRDRFRGALLGVAIGDCLGALLEGRPARNVASLEAWVSEPPRPLRYTDDTHMTLATAGSLVACRGFDAEHMAAALATQYEREPWRGYGEGPTQIFHRMKEGKTWAQAAGELFQGAGSFGNGAAMRVAPVGLLYCRAPEQAVEVARQAARITHFHPLGEDGAALQAGAVAEVLQARDRSPTELLEQLRRHVRTRRFLELLDQVESFEGEPAETIVRELGNGFEAHRSVATAVHTFLYHRQSFAEAVVHALSLGGDADTIASMTGALAGAFWGASEIPSPWIAGLEGFECVIELADQLLELALAVE